MEQIISSIDSIDCSSSIRSIPSLTGRVLSTDEFLDRWFLNAARSLARVAQSNDVDRKGPSKSSGKWN
jgi:hypothetical protein